MGASRRKFEFLLGNREIEILFNVYISGIVGNEIYACIGFPNSHQMILLFKGDYYSRATTNRVNTVFEYLSEFYLRMTFPANMKTMQNDWEIYLQDGKNNLTGEFKL